MRRLDQFVAEFWAALVAGKHLEYALGEVEHPLERPDIFRQPDGAWPAGQTCDYVWRLEDGSRIHAQCFVRDSARRVRLHRDQWDPQASLPRLIAHGLFETPIGGILLAAAGILLFVKAASVK
jgi:hypothetical protein